MAETLRVVFAGGGTGGHLFPALAIAEELQRQCPAVDILFVGTKDKIEASIVPAQGFRFETIWISGFRRSLAPANLVFPLKVMVSLMQSYSLLNEFRPHVVVGTGGYVAGPVLYAATRKGIPTLLQEQNSYPGITTRLLARRATEVHLTFESSQRYLHRTENVIISGNPTRGDLTNVARFEALRYFGFENDYKRTLLVFGGSLGAHVLNDAVEKSLPQVLAHNVRVIWQTGREEYEHAKNVCSKVPEKSVWVNAFIDRMDFAYAASDLVVCRAGATTIAELTLLGKPAILVPYPFAAANHQDENARSMADAGAAEIVYDNEISGKFMDVVSRLLDEKRMQAMSNESKRLAKPYAAHDIAKRIIALADSYKVA